MRITTLALALAVALPSAALAQEQAQQSPDQQQEQQQQAKLSPDAHSLVGKTATGPQGKEVGEIKNVLVGPDGRVQAVVMEVDGKQRAVPWDQVSMQAEQVQVKVDAQQLSKLPEYKAEGG